MSERVLKKEKTLEEKELMKQRKVEKSIERQKTNIKAIKYPMDVNATERSTFDHWIKLGKEFYNLLINQRLEVERFNNRKYYEHHPDKAAEKQRKNDEYKAKIEAEVAAGTRLPKKKFDTPFLSPIQQRHEELRNLPTDVLTHCYGANSIEELPGKDGKEVKINKEGIPQVYLTAFDQSRFGTKLRQSYPEFNIMPSRYWLGICQQVDKAFSDYMKNKISYMKRPSGKYPKPPKFVKFIDDFSFVGETGADNNASVKIDALNGNKWARVFGISNKYFPNGIKINRFKPINGKIIMTAIIKNGDKYFLNVTFEEQKVHWPAKNKSVGVDLGIARNIQLSDGTFKMLPLEKMKALDKKKKNLQRSLRRMVEKSKNYDKRQAKISKISAKIAAIRKYHVAMFATEIARDNELIAIENLKVKNMTKSSKGDSESPGKNVAQKSGLNREMLNIAPYMFRLWVETKGKEYGREVIAVPPQYTSQTCSCCGNIDKESRVSQNSYECVACGIIMNADHNAAINILKKAESNASTTD